MPGSGVPGPHAWDSRVSDGYACPHSTTATPLW
jgi:hypothetical protein